MNLRAAFQIPREVIRVWTSGLKLTPDKSDPSVSILGLWQTYLQHRHIIAQKDPLSSSSFIGQDIISHPFVRAILVRACVRTVSWDGPVRFQVMWSIRSFSGVGTVTSVGSVFLFRFPVYFHTLQQCLSQIWSSTAHTVGAIENLELIMSRWGRESRACERISVQTQKPRCSPACCKGRLVLGLNSAYTFQPNEV